VIAFVYGTTGELIKLAPVLRQLDDRGVSYRLWCTGQQFDELPEASERLGLRQPDRWLARGWRGRSLHSTTDMAMWLAGLMVKVVRSWRTLRRELRSDRSVPMVVVHGDTITTVLGALLGRAARVAVGHIEAGMRSGDWRNPFPEEVDRRIVAHLATVHFAPGVVAVTNLRKARARGPIVDTGVNTIRDALVAARDAQPQPVAGIPERYGLVSLHRSELYVNRAEFGRILGTIGEEAKRTPMVFIDHPVTAAKIEQYGFGEVLGEGVIRLPKQHYVAFIGLVAHSAFALTDSGGLQQECGYLGHPCLVHRSTTESFEGVGDNIVISKLDPTVVRDFLDDPERFRSAGVPVERAPSDIIVQWLEEHGHIRTERVAG
jgi:UDP-N-acetylglucosamine 2-epimerase (non-hydrolysing)